MHCRGFVTFFDNPILLSHTPSMRNLIWSALVLAFGVIAKATLGHNASVSRGSTWSARDNITLSREFQPSAERYSHDLSYKNPKKWVNWHKFKANGVNLGGWFLQEHVIDQGWWDSVTPNATDEWTLCQQLGEQCGPVLEKRYASWITTVDVDKMASVNVNVLRIPVSYSVWIDVPGSQLYHGAQKDYLNAIAMYAIETYNMHIILSLHNLPGGTNNLEIGEAVGHNAWWGNQTNLDWSYKAVDTMLAWIQGTGHMSSFTISPINEPADEPTAFASAAGMTPSGIEWLQKYFNGCLKRIAQVDKRIPMMIQDAFQGASFWSPRFAKAANIAFDTHIYFFANPNATSFNVPNGLCEQVPDAAGDGKFPVFIGEYSVQSQWNNTLASRKTLFDTWRYVSMSQMQGNSFWSWKFTTRSEIDGEGTLKDYWSYEDMIDGGAVTTETTDSYC
ncbi:hypothetical protein V501_10151 [Pseudogymnoascus sp. VKM F-4519 (FW-2642)]|nr:hypothetical protein V501_10151 [Pseudogymnoascus sp. VKM F-4519 (FW-2642)]